MRSENRIINHKVFKYWFRNSFTQRSPEKPLRGMETLSSDQYCYTEILMQVRILFPVLASGLKFFSQTDQSLWKRKHFTGFFCCIPTFPFGHLSELLNKERPLVHATLHTCDVLHTHKVHFHPYIQFKKRKIGFSCNTYNKWNQTRLI